MLRFSAFCICPRTLTKNSFQNSYFIALSLCITHKREFSKSNVELFLIAFPILQFFFLQKLDKDVSTLLYFRSIVPIVNNCIEKLSK